MDSKDNQVHPNFQDYNQHPNAPSYNQAPSSQSMQRYDQVPQQQQQSSTTVVIAQPQQHGNPLLLVDRHGIRDWSTGIFDCCSDVGNCFFTFCCCSCAMASLASRLGECCCTMCCVPAAPINMRTRIRTMGGIRGDMCNDCLTVSCCYMCAACQEARELKNMGL
ncbi:Hypothetical predicted protein [Mytilus galloprovincialis]|uniref:Uncharacterized protein n=1 Tax=Mytilus galloprovincialis TaxID=29158 RepID=A0A8B6EPS2_MYTGA|nr:Hypothetical predicted protein [Mytilus galloprovincialis]